MPSATATWLIDDDSRMYVRYAETLRFPSLFLKVPADLAASQVVAPPRSRAR
ncbi:hypothetical protein QW180_29555 [Vibrio sinaloensis]|nr:hypothetical protein [Vibrio sinaloensis]